LLEQVAESATPIPELFALLTRALDYLESHSPDTRAILHYERELARALGLPDTAETPAFQSLRQVFHLAPTQREKVLATVSGQSPAPNPPPAA